MREDAVEELYRLYAPMVYKYLLCLSKDTAIAEDLTADTFEQAVRGIRRFRGESKLSVWLCAIAKRLYYSELRRRGKHVHVPLETEPLVSEQDIERDYIEKESREEFYRELRTLDTAAREVFYWRLSAEMTFDEIGALMGHSGNWARVTYYRGKEKLKRRMQDDGE